MITFGIINYNNSPYIAQCVNSALNQSLPPSEILIVDDASTDNSKEIIELLQNENSAKKIRAIYLETNSGDPYVPINTIIENTNNPYLFLLASDDYVYPNCLQQLYETITSKTLDFTTGGILLVNNEGKPQESWEIPNVSPRQVVWHVFNTGGSGLLTTVGLYRTEFLKTHGYIKQNGVESDVLNVLHFIKNNYRYKILQEPMIAYRQHDGNNSKSLKKRTKRVLEIMRYIVNNFDSKIFLKQIPSSNPEQQRWIKIAATYIGVARRYITKDLPTYLNVTETQDELRVLAQPFLAEAIVALKKAEEYGMSYWPEIMNFYEEIEALQI